MSAIEPGVAPATDGGAPRQDGPEHDPPPPIPAHGPRGTGRGPGIARFLLIGALLPAFFAGGVLIGPVARDAYRGVFPTPDYTTGDFADLFAASGTQVVMFATKDCPFCEKARALLAAENVAYTERLIDGSERAEAEFIERGGRGVPLLFIGDRRIAGYRELAIRDALERIQPAEGVGLDLQRSPDDVALERKR